MKIYNGNSTSSVAIYIGFESKRAGYERVWAACLRRVCVVESDNRTVV